MSSLLRPHIVLLMIVLFSSSVFAASKIRGKVKDKQSGEPLIGASIVIEGTTQGASTDVNGDYIILNVTPGRYTLRASYLGYQTMTISNVAVNIDLTTDVNFDLSSDAVSLQTVNIVAEAPLVNKNATNTIVQFKADQIENIPVRGVQGVFALAGGVVSQGGNLYVRGGRAGEVAFYVDGVLVNNPMNRQSSLTLINNAIEEVSAQIGGMTAEYGNALSGVVNTSTKVGAPKYAVSAEVITDGFLSNSTPGVLNTYSYGLNDYSLTVSGPVMPGKENIRFFVAGSRTFDRSNASFLDGFKYPVTFDTLDITDADFRVTFPASGNRDSGVVVGMEDGLTGRRANLANLLNSTDLKGGRNFGGLANDVWSLNGNVYVDLKNFNVKVGGTYSNGVNYGSLGKGLGTYRITSGTFRPGKTETEDFSAYAKFTHVLDPKTFYTVNGSVFSFFQEQGDAILFRDYKSYGDPDHPANSYLVSASREPNAFAIFGVSLASPGFMSQKNYTKVSRKSVSGRFDFVRQMNNTWEFKVGAELQRYTLRTYTIGAFSLFRAMRDNPAASDWSIYNKANVTFYGYDIYGNEFDGGSFKDLKSGNVLNLPNEGPRHPTMIGTYLQNKFEMSDLILNIGFRFDYIDPGTKRYKNGNNINVVQIEDVKILDANTMEDPDITMQISPRIGFSFPVTDRTVFHAEYGKFIAQGGLNDLYDATTSVGRFLPGGLARQFPNPNLKPERTTDYQIGFRQQVGDVSAFDLSFFYKETKDLIVIRQIYPEPGATHAPYIGNVNGDFGTVRGLTLRYDIRRIERVALNASYTLQNALATGSASRTHFNIAWQDVSGPNGEPYFPVIPAPTDFDRVHYGNVNLDYRFADNDGPMLFDSKILERAGANFLFNFSSGRRYTKNEVSSIFFPSNAPTPYETINASTAPWNFQMDLRVNKIITLVRGVDLDVYVWVVNLLNTKNIVNIYSATGLPDNDGFFSTAQGKEYVEKQGDNSKKLYDYIVDDLANYGTPRVIRLGARLTF
jgi:outer membrane receptor protein involved in Fe transport